MTASRREFVVGLGAVACGLMACGDPGVPLAIEADLPKAAQRVGKVYLRAHRGERGRLEELIFAGSRWEAVSERGGDVVRRLLAAQIHEDFREGRTVSVAGWVLSVTEARLCALLG